MGAPAAPTRHALPALAMAIALALLAALQPTTVAPNPSLALRSSAWRVALLPLPVAAASPLHHAECHALPRDPACRTVCAFANDAMTAFSTQIVSAMLLYSPALNGTAARPLKWDVALMDIGNSTLHNVSPRAVVRAWLAARGPERCDVLAGTGFAAVDAALSGNVDVPWLEPIVSTPAVLDRTEFPTMVNFLPGVPSTVARTLSAFRGVAAWSIITDASAVGRAWGDAAVAYMAANGVAVDEQQGLAASATDAAIAKAVEQVLAGRSRYVFVAATAVDPIGRRIHAELVRRQASRGKVLLLIDEMCTFNGTASLPESFCVNYGVNAATAAPTLPDVGNYARYVGGYAERFVEVNRTHAEVGIAIPWDAVGGTYFAAVAHDVMLHYMLTAHVGPARPPARADLITHTSTGATGRVGFGPDGVRSGMPLTLHQARADRTVAVVATQTAAGTAWGETAAPLYIQGAARTLGTLPAAYDPVDGSSDSTLSTVIIVVIATVCVAAVAAAAVGLGIAAVSRLHGRDNRHAPKDSNAPFAVAFTDVEASTALWALEPQAMSAAVEQHHDLIRRLMAEHRGYEVKTIGDSFMVAFKDPSDAVAFSLHLQAAFHDAAWDAVITDAYRALAKARGLGAAAVDPSLWNGIRVRVGVHYGEGTITLDPVTKGYDYYGTVVNTASRVEAVGHGGQVIVTDAALAAATAAAPSLMHEATSEHLGDHQLRGLADDVALLQLLPCGLERREFPPLRLERLDADDGLLVVDDNPSPSDSNAQRRRSEGPSDRAAAYHDASDDPYYAFLRTLFSPLPPKERAAALASFVRRWRVTASSAPATLEKSDGAVEKALVGLALRAGSAHQCHISGDRHSAPSHNGSGGEGASHTVHPFAQRVLSTKVSTVASGDPLVSHLHPLGEYGRTGSTTQLMHSCTEPSPRASSHTSDLPLP